MTPERRKLVLAVITAIVALLQLRDEPASSTLYLQPVHTTLYLQRYVTSCHVDTAVVLTQLIIIQLLRLPKKTRDRCLGQYASQIKVPRQSHSMYYVVPRNTEW